MPKGFLLPWDKYWIVPVYWPVAYYRKLFILETWVHSSFTLSNCFMLVRIRGDPEPILETLGAPQSGGWGPHTFTYLFNLGGLFSITNPPNGMFLEGGRKPESWDETHTDTGENMENSTRGVSWAHGVHISDVDINSNLFLSHLPRLHSHIHGTHIQTDTLQFSAQKSETSRNGELWGKFKGQQNRLRIIECTSSSHGLSLRSRMMSKPRTSKQTLSLPGGCPGRHIRYAWSTWGSATISVLTTSSWHEFRKKNTQNSNSTRMFSLKVEILQYLSDFNVMQKASLVKILAWTTNRRWLH